MTDHYAVVGNPVAHSRSPQIHAEFARQTGQDIDYARLFAPLDQFAATVRKFRDEGGKGLNVTVPFKLEAFRLCEPAASAVDAEAVNTLTFDGTRVRGDNTDGVGFLRDIQQNLRCAIAGKRVLIMGAGGATRGVMGPLLRERPALLVVANRTLDKATGLIARFEKFRQFTSSGISALPYAGLTGSQFDIVINATSAGLSDDMPALPAGVFAAGALAYDMVYGKSTPFMRFAAGEGARISDGTGMLVEQAAESFLIWRGVRPATAPVIAILRAQDRGSRIED
jgi:shikimate dehydrogenase